MTTIEREIKNQIMATDVYICLSSDKISETEINLDIDRIVKQMKEFETRYSRFIPNNYLASLNDSESFEAADDLLEIIEAGESYFKKTAGLFDPAIHNFLVNEGYNTTKYKGVYDKNKGIIFSESYTFSNINVDYNNKTITKPKELKIDFGGIGKGYIVDKITEWVNHKYSDFCIDAGGDMFLGGTDKTNDYPYWAIEIENPLEDFAVQVEVPTLVVKDQAVATSGVGKRIWIKDNEQKSHIINPRTGKSVQNDIVSVTVIGNSTVYADVYAKTLLLLGQDDGLNYCNNGGIPAVFINKSGEVIISQDMEKYVWKEKQD